MLRIHDTLSRSLREIAAADGELLRYYSCGPTIHDKAHVGNFRYFCWQDVFKRVVQARGLAVRHVMNVTDVEDKIIARAREKGIDVTDPARLPEVTGEYERALFDDFEALRIRPADAYPHATELVPQMIELVSLLVERGHAYESGGSVYFSVASLPSYGRLSRLDASQVRSGSRVDSDEYEKGDVRDFVLWKGAREGEPRWDSPWGPGRPGWHLECSVMAMECLGATTIDVHAGGEDLVFPHHENEIAQSEGATGEPFCRHWIHCAHLVVDGRKMSKSLGNFFTLTDLVEQGHDPVAIRYLLTSVHYRAPLNVTRDGLEAAAGAVARLNDLARRLSTCSAAAEAAGREAETARATLRRAGSELDACLDDDLNTSGALGTLFGAVRDVNAALAAGSIDAAILEDARELLRRADAVFAFLEPGAFTVASLAREIAGRRYEVSGPPGVPEGVLARVLDRQEARAGKDFATADRLRDELAAEGWVIEDARAGARVRRH